MPKSTPSIRKWWREQNAKSAKRKRRKSSMGYGSGMRKKNYGSCPVCHLEVSKREPHQTRGNRKYHQKCYSDGN